MRGRLGIRTADAAAGTHEYADTAPPCGGLRFALRCPFLIRHPSQTVRTSGVKGAEEAPLRRFNGAFCDGRGQLRPRYLSVCEWLC